MTNRDSVRTADRGDLGDSPTRNRRELVFLGYFGLFPFYAGAVAPWLGVDRLIGLDDGAAIDITIAYGAVIAAFMAGMGSGALLIADRPATARHAPVMIAALIAWIALWPIPNMPPWSRTILLVVVFSYLYLRDARVTVAGGFPDWYGRLRARLSAGAILALLILTAQIASTG